MDGGGEEEGEEEEEEGAAAKDEEAGEGVVGKEENFPLPPPAIPLRGKPVTVFGFPVAYLDEVSNVVRRKEGQRESAVEKKGGPTGVRRSGQVEEGEDGAEGEDGEEEGAPKNGKWMAGEGQGGLARKGEGKAAFPAGQIPSKAWIIWSLAGCVRRSPDFPPSFPPSLPPSRPPSLPPSRPPSLPPSRLVRNATTPSCRQRPVFTLVGKSRCTTRTRGRREGGREGEREGGR